MAVTWVGAAFGVIAGALSLLILAHAFRRSVGTGMMVLLIPAYVLYYAFSQFEHRWKRWVVTSWLCALVLSALLLPLGAHPKPPPSPLSALDSAGMTP